jgi:L-malate glycosyltransferase
MRLVTTMAKSKLPGIALLWSQFAAYHMDRCDAVAKRLQGRADVLAVEVASTSSTYAWERSGGLKHARKVTLFPDRKYDEIGTFRKLWAQFRALRRCRMVFIGIGYAGRDIVILSWLLWLCGVEVVLMSESKFDDYPRELGAELLKSLSLSPYSAAICGGRRQLSYFRFLGFRRRVILPGYDGVSIERVRSQADHVRMPFEDRHFIFVGRFVAKKNLVELVEAYSVYVQNAKGRPRKLVLVGSGPLEQELRTRVDDLGLGPLVEFPGFLQSPQVSNLLASAIALVLVSTVEQWGLVVNEALALGLPVIVSTQVGARDALVRNLVNGYIVETGSVLGFARAFEEVATNEAHWDMLSQGSQSFAWLADTERLADAVELLFDPLAVSAADHIADFMAELGPEPAKDGV